MKKKQKGLNVWVVFVSLISFVACLFSIVNAFAKEFRESNPAEYWGLASPAIAIGLVMITLGIYLIVSFAKKNIMGDELTARAIYKSGFLSFLFTIFEFVVFFVVLGLIALASSQGLASMAEPIIFMFIATNLIFMAVLFFIVSSLIIQKKGYVNSD